MSRSARLAVLVLVALTGYASAAPLLGNPAAYNDGLGPDGGKWDGTTPFLSGTLAGHIDWAVFNAATFPYGGTGYTPTSSELTYAYQIFVTGTAPLSSFALSLDNSPNGVGDNIGAFTGLTGSAPTSSTLTNFTSATWRFAGIPQSSTSEGLAFSSTQRPQSFFGVVVDTGQTAFTVPLPSPGPLAVPEPTAGLLSLSLVAVALIRRRV